MGSFIKTPDVILQLCIPRCDSFSELLGLRLISKRFNKVITSDSYWKCFSRDNYEYLFHLLEVHWNGLNWLDVNSAKKFLATADLPNSEVAKRLVRDGICRIPYGIRHIYHCNLDFDFDTIMKHILIKNLIHLKMTVKSMRMRRKLLMSGLDFQESVEMELTLMTCENKIKEIGGVFASRKMYELARIHLEFEYF